MCNILVAQRLSVLNEVLGMILKGIIGAIIGGILGFALNRIYTRYSESKGYCIFLCNPYGAVIYGAAMGVLIATM